ncbi:MAG: anti-sigma factor [Candidatus Kaistia colombiensis]|nr:MAG: anti-sigma factor [Kaistia sp.]
MTDTSRPDDARLIAYLDGELLGEERDALTARLASDEPLRARLDRIQRGGRLLAPAFEALRAEAPRARLEARLAAAIATDETRLVLERPRARAWRFPQWQPRLVAAALALFVLGGVAGVSLDGRMGRDTSVTEATAEGWRQAVAEYWSLTTPDTLALTPTPERAAAELQAASAKLGVDLSAVPDAFPGLSFRGAQLFDFHGRPLVQIAYLDPQHGPIAYCVIADPDHKERAPTTEELDGFTVVHWASGGQARLLIGRAPAERLQELAQKVTG